MTFSCTSMHGNLTVRAYGYRERARASGPVLPTTGRSTWGVRIDHASQGGMLIGVCDEMELCGWGMSPYSGKIHHAETCAIPEGYPDGRHALVVGNGFEFPAVRPAIGAVIECIFHHDEGALWYRINDGPRCFALDGFPPGAALRPWVRLWCGEGDRVSFVRPFLV